MAITLKISVPQCRLLLRKSRVSFAERKTTMSKVTDIGLSPAARRNNKNGESR